ncbi:unnamed protein product, partial [Staurois parvus]
TWLVTPTILRLLPLYHAARTIPTRLLGSGSVIPSIQFGSGSVIPFTAGSTRAYTLSGTPLPPPGVPRDATWFQSCTKSIPTIRGPGEKADWDLDSASWETPCRGPLEIPLGGA